MLSYEQVMKVLELGLHGSSVLFRSVDNIPEPMSIIMDRLWIVEAQNQFQAAEAILSGVGGFFYDPNNLLDAAIVEKMIIVL
jgi:hypothetical protein